MQRLHLLPDQLHRDDPFCGKVAIITGGTSAFGRAVTDDRTRQGVYVAFDGRGETLGREAEAETRRFGGAIDLTPVDVMDYDGKNRRIENVAASQAGIDFLHARAGIAHKSSLVADGQCLNSNLLAGRTHRRVGAHPSAKTSPVLA